MNTLEILQRLSSIPGVSGDETRVREATIELIKDYCEYKTDAVGNLIASKKGAKRPKNRLMLSAHMDEVGLIVTGVDDSGLVRFDTVGGIDNRVIFGRAVEIGENRICGVIGAKVLHQTEDKEREEPLAPEKLYIDIGANDKADALKYVLYGDRIVFSSEFTRLGTHRIAGRAFDDRAGCAILVSLIQSELPYDCEFVFTVQEEIGCVGAQTAAYAVNPDIAIVVEATTASDIAGVEPSMTVCEQGKGAAISFMDKGAVYDRELYELAIKTAKDNALPCQTKAGVFGGNDSKSIQTAQAGVRVIAVNLPCRYIHTANCTLDISDIENTQELLQKLILAACEI